MAERKINWRKKVRNLKARWKTVFVNGIMGSNENNAITDTEYTHQRPERPRLQISAPIPQFPETALPCRVRDISPPSAPSSPLPAPPEHLMGNQGSTENQTQSLASSAFRPPPPARSRETPHQPSSESGTKPAKVAPIEGQASTTFIPLRPPPAVGMLRKPQATSDKAPIQSPYPRPTYPPPPPPVSSKNMLIQMPLPQPPVRGNQASSGHAVTSTPLGISSSVKPPLSQPSPSPRGKPKASAKNVKMDISPMLTPPLAQVCDHCQQPIVNQNASPKSSRQAASKFEFVSVSDLPPPILPQQKQQLQSQKQYEDEEFGPIVSYYPSVQDVAAARLPIKKKKNGIRDYLKPSSLIKRLPDAKRVTERITYWITSTMQRNVMRNNDLDPWSNPQYQMQQTSQVQEPTYASSDRHGARQKKPRPDNTGSSSLSEEENKKLFAMLGHDCYSLAAAPCQLLRADKRRWTVVNAGVVCLVKDYIRRIYVIRMFDLIESLVLWEQVLYRLFEAVYHVHRPEFMQFEGDAAVYGLNFAFDYEARNFHYHLRKRRDQELKLSKPNKSNAPTSNVQTPSKLISTAGITQTGTVSNVRHLEDSAFKKLNKKSKKKEKKQKIRKEDIGNPINFQHKAHIGWNQDGGFNQQIFDQDPMDDSVRALLRAAGHDPDTLKKEDVEFVYRFIDNYNEPSDRPTATASVVPPSPPVVHQVPASYSAKPTPPVPTYASRNYNAPSTSETRHNRPLPQLPPASAHLPQVPRHEQVPARPPPPPPPPAMVMQQAPPSLPGNRTASLKPAHPVPAPISAAAPPPPPPPPPAAMKSNGAVAPPPPPPPPGLMGASAEKELPPKTPGRSDLLAQIQAGTKLKHVGTPSEKSPAGLGKVANGGSARDNVMNEIKQGANLRHVDQTEVAESRKSCIAKDMPGMAGALARALESRRNRLNVSDSEDDADDDSEWEDD